METKEKSNTCTNKLDKTKIIENETDAFVAGLGQLGYLPESSIQNLRMMNSASAPDLKGKFKKQESSTRKKLFPFSRRKHLERRAVELTSSTSKRLPSSPTIPELIDQEDMHGFVNSDKRKLSDGAKSILSVNTISAAPVWEAPASWQIDAESPDQCFQVREEGTEDFGDTTKLCFVRVFKPDNTFSTISCKLTHTTKDVLITLCKKYFGSDYTKYTMIIEQHGLERRLGRSERPVAIYLKFLTDFGYQDLDRMLGMGRDDNAYLFKFVIKEKGMQKEHIIDALDSKGRLVLGQHNMQTIPISLYRKTAELVSLDCSGNLQLDIPTDFMQACTCLKHLVLSNMMYSSIPESLQCLVNRCKSLDLSTNRITDVDMLVEFKRFQALNLENNWIMRWPREFNSGDMFNLTTLNIANNRLASFPQQLFFLAQLTSLDISFNKIGAINLPDDIDRDRFPRLEYLDLTGNFIPTFDWRLFNGGKMRSIKLARNVIERVEGYFSLVALQLLDISRNKLSTLECDGWDVVDLDISHNPLASVTGNIVNLKRLEMSYCLLESVDDIMLSLCSLEALNISNNRLKMLPEFVHSELIHLDCANNLVEMIPDCWFGLKTLRAMDVHNNRIKKVSNSIWEASLKTINLSSNILDSLPRHSGKIKNELALHLEYLYLADNRLTDDVFGSIKMLRNLRVLNLSINEIYEVPQGGFVNFTEMEELYIAGNRIAQLPSEEIPKLRMLKKLDVAGNKLRSLPAELGKLLGLEYLDAGSNQLKYNTANWPYDWNWNWNLALKYLNLSDNPQLEIRADYSGTDKNLGNFESLVDLRSLGLVGVSLAVLPPIDNKNRRIRTFKSKMVSLELGVADRSDDHGLLAWDLVVQNINNDPNRNMIGIVKLDNAPVDESLMFVNEQLKLLAQNLRPQNGGENRCFEEMFVGLQKMLFDRYSNRKMVCTVCYLDDRTLYVANVGDVMAILGSEDGKATLVSQSHSVDTNEEFGLDEKDLDRVKKNGFLEVVDGKMSVNGKSSVTRCLGALDESPAISCLPYVRRIELLKSDEFLIVATSSVWQAISYQLALDTVRSERGSAMRKAQRVRDLVMAYKPKLKVSIVVIVVDLRKLFSSKLGTNDNKEPKEIGRTMEPGHLLAPQGLVVLLMSDVKNSTRMWENHPSQMALAIRTHNLVLRNAIRKTNGYEVKTEGDAFIIAFYTLLDALLCALIAQLDLMDADWPSEILGENGRPEDPDFKIYRGLSVRMGLHVGTPLAEIDPITRRMDYFGPMVNKAAKVAVLADGGEIAVSKDVMKMLHNIDEYFKICLGPNMQLERNDSDKVKSANDVRLQEIKTIGLYVLDRGNSVNEENVFMAYPRKLMKRANEAQNVHTKGVELGVRNEQNEMVAISYREAIDVVAFARNEGLNFESWNTVLIIDYVARLKRILVEVKLLLEDRVDNMEMIDRLELDCIAMNWFVVLEAWSMAHLCRKKGCVEDVFRILDRFKVDLD